MPLALDNRFTRFIIVGCSNAIISYAVFALLFYSGLFPASLRTPLSQVASYSAGIVWSFCWNRQWAFKRDPAQQDNVWTETVRFVMLQLGCLLLSTAMVTLFVDYLGMLPSFGWLLAMAIITAINYAGMHYWVFRLRQ